MKLDQWVGNKVHLGSIVIGFLLIVVSFVGYFHSEAQDYLQDVASRMSQSNTYISVIDKTISYTASLNIPLIKGYAENAQKDLDNIEAYLTVSRILVKVQEAILNISNLFVFKILAMLCFIGLFLNRVKKQSFKLLILFLCINPGLSLYVHGMHTVADTLKFDLGLNLHRELESIKSDFQQKENQLKKRQQEKKAKQLEKARAKGRDHLGIIVRGEDAIVNTFEEVGLKAKQDIRMVKEIVRIDTETVLVHVLNLITGILVMYVLLPLLYLYLLNRLLKSLFRFSLYDVVDSILK